MRRLHLAALLVAFTLPATARAETLLRWQRPDRTGLEAWAALQAAMPDLGEDARRPGFVPSRALRQISIDLNRDMRDEILLLVDTPARCGSDGCMVAVMTRTMGGSWLLLCTTLARPDQRVRLHPHRRGEIEWRRFDTSARITFRRLADHRVVCDEAPLP